MDMEATLPRGLWDHALHVLQTVTLLLTGLTLYHNVNAWLVMLEMLQRRVDLVERIAIVWVARMTIPPYVRIPSTH